MTFLSPKAGKQLFERLKSAIEDKSKSWGTNFSLKKQFEVRTSSILYELC